MKTHGWKKEKQDGRQDEGKFKTEGFVTPDSVWWEILGRSVHGASAVASNLGDRGKVRKYHKAAEMTMIQEDVKQEDKLP